MVDQNSLTITYETAKHDEKNRKFSQKALWCCRALVHAWSSVLQCGKKQNCPTCKRKNQNRTIKVEQKVLISVVVTAQSKVSFVYGPGAVGFLPWWDCCRIYMHPIQHGEGRNLLPESKRLALPYRAPAHRWLGGMVDHFLFSLIKFINKSRWNKPKFHDLLPLKGVDFGPKIVFGILQIWWFFVWKHAL